MRNAAPILDSEALVTFTRTHKLKIFEALPPQFLFREQWLLVESLLSHGSGISPFQDNISSGGTGFRSVVSKGGSAKETAGIRSPSLFTSAYSMAAVGSFPLSEVTVPQISSSMGKTDIVTHEMKLKSDLPLIWKPYRNCPFENKITKSELQKM
ncbi:hypothetical protein AVEN_20646-1 [Araneus ventricosus]|uniref:Uncharacterized protein n=1 Tax=Araneus ventricosus TaxID=182803 RepID=A0A4Y2IWA3_ARAVE|nr:hypothetical protein AVEN_20646-1 [Araneus ventricosus]